MKTRHLFFLAILLFHQYGYAQTAEDALRYSRIYYGGTARFNGLSGAFGAVGADFSTLATNPAGLGLYRGSEMTFTIAPNIAYTSSTYNGTKGTDDRVNFGLGNFGAVFNINTANQPKAGILKSINIGFGFNRQNDFNNRVFIHGINMENSLMQNYVNILNSNPIAPSDVEYEYPFDIGLAYNANLIVYDSINGYWCDAKSGGVSQDKTITSYGSINELDFSVGANLADKLFLGLTIGVPFLNYYESSLYRETRVVSTVPNFRSLNFYNDLHTRGTGYNFKFGLIYKPADWVRIGAAIHSPTWYPGMKDEWAASMQSSFDSVYWNRTVYSPIGYYDYRMKTPFRAMGNLAFIVGQYGLISADYEFVDYSQARFNSVYDSYSDLNNEIQSSFQSWGNLRLGTEWRLMDFRIRGGFAYFSNPYTGGNNNSERYQFSGGLGYRSKYFFADLTYVYSRMTQSYYLYDATMVNPAEIINYSHSILTTFGVRF